MTTQIKRRRGTTTQHASFTGAEGELTVDTTKDTVVVHDGSTAGGHPLAKASEAVAKSGDTMTGDLALSGADVTFGDNDKAIFGAGSDLQIYSDGTTGQIAGNLNITGTLTSDGLTVQTSNGVGTLLESSVSYQYLQFKNSTETNNYLGFVNDDFTVTAGNVRYLQVEGNGDISFYEDTGTTPKFFWDASAEKLGLGTTSPDHPITIQSSSDMIKMIDAQNTSVYHRLYSASDSSLVLSADAGNANSGQLRFFTTDTERMVISSSGSVGIGTSSPSVNGLEVSGSGDRFIFLQSSTSSDGVYIKADSGGDGTEFQTAGGQNKFAFRTNGSLALTIDSSGVVEVPNSGQFKAASSNATKYVRMYAGGGTGKWDIYGNGANLRISDNMSAGVLAVDTGATFGGNVGIGTSSPTSSYGTNLNVHSSATNGAALHLTDGTTGNTSNDGFHLISTGGLAYVWNREATDMVFGTANLTRMTVDSSGNLLVGTSNENLDNTSTETGVVLRNNEKSAFSRDGGVPLYINRLTSPGGLLYFQNDGVNVGSIGIQSGGFTIDGEANHTGLMFAAASVLPRDNSANTNGTIDLGTNDGRWKDLYLSGNIDVTTTTSGLISAGAARQGSIIKLHHEAQWEAGYNSTPTDFLGAVEFSSGDASGSGLAGTGVRAAIRAYVKDAYNNVGLSFETGGSRAEAMRIDPSGNVGIAAVPEASYAPSLAIGYGGNNITSRGNADFRIMSGAFQDGASTFQYSVSSVPVAMLSMTNGGFAFAIAPAGTDGGAATFTNNMVLHASGALLVGNSGNWAAGADVCMIEANGLIDISRNDTSTQSAIAFYNPNGGIGSITVGGSATSYNTSSDYRLKTDAQPMTGASARVQALNPVNFEWIASGDRVDGFLAHEAQAVVPEAVTGTKDAMRDEEYEVTAAIEATYDDEGNELTAAVEAVMGTRSVPDMQGIDQSKLVPLLTAALQEALTEITALKARVTALEG